MANDFFDAYFEHIGETEVPAFFHRWSAIVGVGAFLSKGYYLPFGHSTIYPNIYAMLIGEPGTRKSTAIKIMKKLLIKANFNSMAPDKTTKEKFLLDLAETNNPSPEDFLDAALFGDSTSGSTTDCLIAADEFNDFFGNDILDFVSMLGVMWDYEGNYENKVKNGKSVTIPNPNISILGGNTPTQFSKAFPPEAIGQGFFSRLLLVHAESTGKRITFPVPPSIESTNNIISCLVRMKESAMGLALIDAEAREMLDTIYKGWSPIDDPRFDSYANRRFTHLLKMCLITSAVNYSSKISPAHVIQANTILSHTEQLMPKALGEFGKAKNSDTVNKVVTIITKHFDTKHVGITVPEIYQLVSSDITKVAELVDIMKGLLMAKKVQVDDGKYLPVRKVIKQDVSGLIDYSYLTIEERNMTK